MYRTVDAAFWTDQKVRKLSPLDRLLFLYLITNPHTHVSGLYYLPKLIAQHETGLTVKQLDSASDTLSRTGRAVFDHPNELVWVVKMMRFQGRGQKNTLSAAHHLSKDVHNSFLINKFLEEYPEVGQHLKNRVSGDAPPENGERRTDTENGERIWGIPDSDQPTRKLKRAATPAPDKIELTPDMIEFAKGHGVTDPEDETHAMLDHFRGKGESKADWIATWRNWMRNSKRFSPGGNRNGRNETQSAAAQRAARNRAAKERVLAGLTGTDGADSPEGHLR